VSADLQGMQTTYSWNDWANPTKEPISVLVDATWTTCTLMPSAKSMYKYNAPFSKSMYKDTTKYADGCTLDVALDGDVTVPFDPTTSSGSLFGGDNMSWYMEKNT